MVDRSKPWSVAAILLALSSVGLSLATVGPVRGLWDAQTDHWAWGSWRVLVLFLALLAAIAALPAGIEGFSLARRLSRRRSLAWVGLALGVLPLAALVIGTAIAFLMFLGCRTGPI